VRVLFSDVLPGLVSCFDGALSGNGLCVFGGKLPHEKGPSVWPWGTYRRLCGELPLGPVFQLPLFVLLVARVRPVPTDIRNVSFLVCGGAGICGVAVSPWGEQAHDEVAGGDVRDCLGPLVR
jgi:hypothetical protein